MASLEEIGQYLQNARRQAGITLKSVEQETNIRTRFLEAIEAGRFSELPSLTQIRGFTRNYAIYLHLDPDEILTQLDFALNNAGLVRQNPSQPAPNKPKLAPPVSASPTRRGLFGKKIVEPPALTSLSERASPTVLKEFSPQDPDEALIPTDDQTIPAEYQSVDLSADDEMPGEALETPRLIMSAPSAHSVQVPWRYRLRRMLTVDLFLALLLLLTSGLFLVWAGSLTLQATAQIDNSPIVLGGTPRATATSSATALATTTASENLLTYDSVSVDIRVTQTTFARIVVDGIQQFAGTMLPGETVSYSNVAQVQVSVSNAAGMRVVHNSVDIGALGQFGEVVEVTFLPNSQERGTVSNGADVATGAPELANATPLPSETLPAETLPPPAVSPTP
jgi:cytoskeletal protein RodZ